MDNIELPPEELLAREDAGGSGIDWTDPANLGATAAQRAAFRRGYLAAIAADRAKREIPSAQPAPAGYALVPLEPTPAMIDAGQAAYETALLGSRRDVTAAFIRRWRAMLAAASAAPAATHPAPTDAHVSLAHELWAAAQLAPGEGIADGADRVAAILATQPAGQEAPDHIADVNKMVLDAARYRFLRDNEYASWRPYSLRAGYSATEADALVDAAMSAQAGGGKA